MGTARNCYCGYVYKRRRICKQLPIIIGEITNKLHFFARHQTLANVIVTPAGDPSLITRVVRCFADHVTLQ